MSGGGSTVTDGSRPDKQLAQIAAKAWADEGFKTRLLREPAQVLREHGISVPDGVEIRIVENTDRVVHLVLPPRPEEELTEEQLARVTGGMCAFSTLCSGLCV